MIRELSIETCNFQAIVIQSLSMTFSTEHTVFYTLRVCTLCVIRYYIFKNIGVTMKNERDYKLRRED